MIECNCCKNRMFVEKMYVAGEAGKEVISIVTKNPVRGTEIAIDLSRENVVELIEELMDYI